MQTTLGELALLVDGQVVGPDNLAIQGAAPLRDAGPGEITLVDRAERGRTLADSKAAAVLCPRSFTPGEMPAILVDDVHAAFAKIVLHFHPPPRSETDRRQPLIGSQHVRSARCERRCPSLRDRRR